MDSTLIPISEKEFRKVAKGCGIKYRNKIPSKELKAMLGYCPLYKLRKVEIRDETGFCKVFDTTKQGAIESGISSQSVMKYAIDHERNFVKRRSDKKIFYVRNLFLSLRK
jgi:hypothetical protein